MTEETNGASTGGPKALVRAIYISIIAGFILNLAMTLAIQGGTEELRRPGGERDSGGRRAVRASHFGRRRKAIRPDLDGRDVLLRPRVGDGELADDLRVLA